MVAITSGVNVYEAHTGSTPVADSPNGYKEIIVTAPDTADNTNTIAITLGTYGITTFKYIKGFTHTTEGALIIPEAPTTSVTAGVLTITIGGSTANKFRAFIVGGI